MPQKNLIAMEMQINLLEQFISFLVAAIVFISFHIQITPYHATVYVMTYTNSYYCLVAAFANFAVAIYLKTPLCFSHC